MRPAGGARVRVQRRGWQVRYEVVVEVSLRGGESMGDTGAGEAGMALCGEHPAAHIDPITWGICLGKLPGVDTYGPHEDGSGMG